VVRGEPGVGKTVLLDYLGGRASECRGSAGVCAAGDRTRRRGLHQL